MHVRTMLLGQDHSLHISLCIGFSETCLCPAPDFVVAPASGMVRYRDPVFHPFVHPIMVLSYSRH